MISHNMHDVFSVADRVAVLYLGQMVAVRPTAEFDLQSIVALMTAGNDDQAAAISHVLP